MSQWLLLSTQFVWYRHRVSLIDPLGLQPPPHILRFLIHSEGYFKSLVYCVFLPSEQLTPYPLLLPLRAPPFIQTCTAAAAVPGSERRRRLTSWSCEPHLKRRSSWADTRAPLRWEWGERKLYNGVTNCIFSFFSLNFLFLLSVASSSGNMSPHHHHLNQTSATPWSGFLCLFFLNSERKACGSDNEGG